MLLSPSPLVAPEHADCGSDEYCYDVMAIGASGIALVFPHTAAATLMAIRSTETSPPRRFAVWVRDGDGVNCEHVCEGHGYDEARRVLNVVLLLHSKCRCC